MRESHVSKQSKGRTNIGAAFERAAAAVDDVICCSRKGSRPFLNVCETLFGGGTAVECRAGDVASCKEGTKTDIHDRGASVSACRGKFADEVGGLHELRCRQGLGKTWLSRLAVRPRQWRPANDQHGECTALHEPQGRSNFFS